MIAALDGYAIATLALMALFVATFAGLAIAEVLSWHRDDEPWIDPEARYAGADREAWER